MSAASVWVLTDGRAGMLMPARGLAERVGLPFEERRVALAPPWRWLPPALWPRGVLGQQDAGSPLAPPWPRLLISCGRHSVGPALEIKRRAGGKCLAVHIQHPRAGLNRFDLVAAPLHDRLSGTNVVATLGSLHGVTPSRIALAAERHRRRLEWLPRPRVAVLVGGSNRVYRLTPDYAASLAEVLRRLCRDAGAGLMITTSRRTGATAETALRHGLSGAAAEIWDGGGENPYLAYLGLADHIAVTCDSVNMMSEACATGKPVHIIELEEARRNKFTGFREALYKAEIARPFDGRLREWRYEPLDETGRVADIVRRRLEAGLDAGS